MWTYRRLDIYLARHVRIAVRGFLTPVWPLSRLFSETQNSCRVHSPATQVGPHNYCGYRSCGQFHSAQLHRRQNCESHWRSVAGSIRRLHLHRGAYCIEVMSKLKNLMQPPIQMENGPLPGLLLEWK